MSQNQEIEPHSIISVRIQTRACKNEISEILADGKIKIRLKAPPIEGRANTDLIRFLGKALDTAQSNLKIVNGFTSREKLVYVANMDSEYIYQRLRELTNNKW